MFNKKKKDNKDYVLYPSALTDKQILEFALILDQFQEKEIDFPTMIKLYQDLGVSVEPVFTDYEKHTINRNQLEAIRERRARQEYTYEDLSHLSMEVNHIKNVIFRIDHKAIRVLAAAGYTKYQKILLGILQSQIRLDNGHSYEAYAERMKWIQEAKELTIAIKEKEEPTVKR